MLAKYTLFNYSLVDSFHCHTLMKYEYKCNSPNNCIALTHLESLLAKPLSSLLPPDHASSSKTTKASFCCLHGVRGHLISMEGLEIL